jgi:gamma-glutamyltranspeptidase
VIVPGVVAGWTRCARFGALPMSDILAPAIYYANGFPITDIIVRVGRFDAEACRSQRREGHLVNGRGRRPAMCSRIPN